MVKAIFLFLVICCATLGFGGPAGRKLLTVKGKIDHGCVLVLSDGSAWEIRPENRAKADAWPAKGHVTIYKINDPGFPYRIVLSPEDAAGDVVAANRLIRVR